jgi:hypothetical protein
MVIIIMIIYIMRHPVTSINQIQFAIFSASVFTLVSRSSSKVLRKLGILPHHYTASLHPEDGGSNVLRNIGVVAQHYAASLQPEDGGTMLLRNFGILPHHYIVSQPRIRLEKLAQINK